jgi:hypothetical protein
MTPSAELSANRSNGTVELAERHLPQLEKVVVPGNHFDIIEGSASSIAASADQFFAAGLVDQHKSRPAPAGHSHTLLHMPVHRPMENMSCDEVGSGSMTGNILWLTGTYLSSFHTHYAHAREADQRTLAGLAGCMHAWRRSLRK